MTLPVNKNLEELFDLPEFDPSAENDADTIEEFLDVEQEVERIVDKVDKALPLVKGLEAADAEFDDLAAIAKEGFKDLMDLGMNVEAIRAAEIFSVAATMLGHSINAKTAKVNKKLKMIDLQLRKERNMMASKTTKPQVVENEEGEQEEQRPMDRNELLRIIKGGEGK